MKTAGPSWPLPGEPSVLLDNVVLPGDVAAEIPSSGELKIGSGLVPREGSLVVGKPGVFRATHQGKLWVEASHKRYIPQLEDLVIGVVLDKAGETVFVDIRAPSRANLSGLAFEGATRRNRPNLKPGDVVYARVCAASRDMDPEISCVDSVGRAMGFGVLKGGSLVQCSTALARHLLSRPPAPILLELGRQVSFEIAVGMNGRVWINAASPRTVTIVSAAIRAAETASDTQLAILVSKMLAAAREEEADGEA